MPLLWPLLRSLSTLEDVPTGIPILPHFLWLPSSRWPPNDPTTLILHQRRGLLYLHSMTMCEADGWKLIFAVSWLLFPKPVRCGVLCWVGGKECQASTVSVELRRQGWRWGNGQNEEN